MRSLAANPHRLVVPALAALLLGLGSVGAGAAPPPGTASQADSPVIGSGSAVARCPSGKLISGGFAAPGFDRQEAPAVRVSALADGPREWAVDAVSMDGPSEEPQPGPDPGGPPNDPPDDDDDDSPAQGTISSIAYCGKLAPGTIRARRVDGSVPDGGYGTVTARCRPGERAIAGGFAAPGFGLAENGGAIALASHKAGKRGWTVGGARVDSGAPGALSAIAYCLKRAPRLVTRSLQISGGAEQLRTFDVSCPAGHTAVSGGFDGHVQVSGESMAGSGVIESFRAPQGGGWTTTALSIDDSAGATVTAYVYCLRAS